MEVLNKSPINSFYTMLYMAVYSEIAICLLVYVEITNLYLLPI